MPKSNHNIGRGNNFEDMHQHDYIAHKVKLDVAPFDGTYNLNVSYARRVHLVKIKLQASVNRQLARRPHQPIET